jgi:GntR family transcriptional regulator, rspAB operon transcriptional repressor
MIPTSAPPLQEAAAAPVRLTPLSAYSGSLAQRVYLSLKEAILTLSYGPGDILRKPEICAALGVSRSPVAEAVARLQAEHLVTVLPQAGTYVARLSMQEVREGAFLREALELAAVELVARDITEDQLVLLRRNLRVQAAHVADHDFAGFYLEILSFTGFRRLSALAESAWVHVNRARRLVLPTPGRLEETLEEHQAILAALEAHDPAAARAATRAHLGQLIAILEPIAATRRDLFDPE